MWSGGHLLSIILLCLIAVGRLQSQQSIVEPEQSGSCRSPETSTVVPGPKCDYVMMTPFKLTVGAEGVVCTWLRCAVPVTCTVTLEYYLQKTIIVSKEGTSGFYECTHFTVPEVDKDETVYFSFSATGDNVNVASRRSAVIDVPQSACLAQRSQPLYKPGDTVQLRYPCFNENMKQDVKNFTKVTFVDPNGARVNQIVNPTLNYGVVELSFPTSEFSLPGYWSIQLDDDKGETQYTYFVLQKYELPRFNWDVKCPNTISVLDKVAVISGSAQYVYGESVPGTVVGRCCRNTPKYGNTANCFRGVNDLCQDFTIELDKDGKFVENLDMDVFKLPFSGLDNYVSCDFTLKEQGTDVLVPAYCSMWITNRLAILQLDRNTIGSYYNKVNIPFAATLTDEKNNPLIHKSITVRIDGVDVKYVTTDVNGRAECMIETSSYVKANITLSATYEDPGLCYGVENNYMYPSSSQPSDDTVLYRSYTQSGSQIRVRSPSGELSCYENYKIPVDYSFTKEGVGEDATTVSIKYIILSRDNIAGHGEIPLDLSQSYKGSASIEFYADHKYATEAKILVIVPLTKDVISDTTTLNMGVCFENKVDMVFTEDTVRPGATVYRKITAEPGSFCGSRVKDISFNSLASYDEFNPYNIFSYVKTYLFGLQYKNVNYEEPEPSCTSGDTEYWCNGMYVKQTSSRTDRDANQDFEDLSILFSSNLKTRRPKVCGMENEYYPYPMYASNIKGMAFDAEGAPPVAFSRTESADGHKTVRVNFDNIFGYDTMITGPDGEATMTSQIPDVITAWLGDAFCISHEKGIGLTIEPAKVTTIQPFFVEASMPSYVIRGEAIVISIVAANYIGKCAKIKAEVNPSANYEVTPLGDMGDQCACSNERVSWTVEVVFTTIGKVDISITAEAIVNSEECGDPKPNPNPDPNNNDKDQTYYSDTIIMPINVEVEGIKREATSSHLVKAKDSTDSTGVVSISVAPPDQLVPDSFHLSCCVMGDPIALSVKYFNNLLSNPSGCSDQYQSRLLSILWLYNYLKYFEQLSEEQSLKMQTTLSLGYMDLLSYRTYNGGYRLYPNSYEENSWVTISSLRTIHHLDAILYVDEDIQTQGLLSISRTQNLESGCLVPQGGWSIYQGTYDASIQFTALCAPILLELAGEQSNAGPLLEGVNKCLENVDFYSQDTLTQCYLLDAAASFGDWEKWQSYYNALEEKSVYDGDTLYWLNDNPVTPVRYQYFRVSDVGDVLSTALVLISWTKNPDLDETSINFMACMAKWLSGKMTLQGGYYSSQATAAAIEALTRFGKIINTGETNARVSIFQGDDLVFEVTVDRSNRFIVQCKDLSPGFGDYTIHAVGSRSPFVQFKTFYNTKIATPEDSAYTLTVQAIAPECRDGVAKIINIQVTLSYGGVKDESLTFFTVHLLTGFELFSFSTGETPSIVDWRREENKVLFFIRAVKGIETTFTVPIYATGQVSSYEARFVVAEEMDTGETGDAQYYYPCQDQATEE